MTKEEKNKMLRALANDRNEYAKECNRRIAEENGRINGADYMLQRFLDLFDEDEVIADDAENELINKSMAIKQLSLDLKECGVGRARIEYSLNKLTSYKGGNQYE